MTELQDIELLINGRRCGNVVELIESQIVDNGQPHFSRDFSDIPTILKIEHKIEIKLAFESLSLVYAFLGCIKSSFDNGTLLSIYIKARYNNDTTVEILQDVKFVNYKILEESELKFLFLSFSCEDNYIYRNVQNIKINHDLDKRYPHFCFKCRRVLEYSDALKQAIFRGFTEDHFKLLWKRKEIQFYCCDCYPKP